MLERAFMSKLRSRLLERFPGCFYYKIPDTGALGGKRPFDSILLYNGKAFAIEGKKDGKCKPTHLQMHNLRWAAMNGAICLVVHPGNWKNTLKYIEEKANDRNGQLDAGLDEQVLRIEGREGFDGAENQGSVG